MHDVRSFLIVLILISFAGATPVIGAEDTSSPPVKSDPIDVVRQVAAALAAGNDAIEDLRGAPIEHSNLDRLKLPTPGMDCGIGRSLIFVACQSASLKKDEAEALFTQIMNDVRHALPADTWKVLDAAPNADLIRIKSYYHLRSGAQIDIGLVSQPTSVPDPAYWLRVYGWNRF